MQPTTTPPWAPDIVDSRDLLRVPKKWPVTTLYVVGVAILFVLLCWAEAAW
jgi:hypothetical protein